MTNINQQTLGQRVTDAPAREQIAATAAEHGWDATIEHATMHEFKKAEQTLLVHYQPGTGALDDVIFYRGEIGLAHLAPTDSALDSALRWLAGLQA